MSNIKIRLSTDYIFCLVSEPKPGKIVENHWWAIVQVFPSQEFLSQGHCPGVDMSTEVVYQVSVLSPFNQLLNIHGSLFDWQWLVCSMT